MGRRLFEIVDAATGWSDEMGYGAGMVGTPSFFVLTHSPPDRIRLKLDFTFVTSGLADAIRQAQAKAGERNVVIMGGAQVIRDAVANRLVDELSLHLSPVLLGAGTPLFGDDHHELVQLSAVPSRTATHLRYGFRDAE
jgi:dihydrofolate reductase